MGKEGGEEVEVGNIFFERGGDYEAGFRFLEICGGVRLYKS